MFYTGISVFLVRRHVAVYFFELYYIYSILHACSCITEFIKRFGEIIRCEAVPSISSVFPNEFNKFNKCLASYLFPNSFNKLNNTGARMQDSIYHMTLKSHFIRNFALKRHAFDIRKRDVFVDVNA